MGEIPKKQLLLFLLTFLLILLAFPFTLAQSGRIKLVSTIQGINETLAGGTPDMLLEIRPGKGNIFIESFPLTKVDTQISTRFANAVACDFLGKDCSRHDFFYTIKADTNLISGPSAGGAITVLTVAVIDNQKIDQSIAMTGTINSGGLIGPVGGLKEKAIAAQSQGLKKLIIPKLSLTNTTTINSLSENISIDIIPVSSLEDALYYFTGKNYSKTLPELEVPLYYTETMHAVSDKLCERYIELEKKQDISSLEKANNSLYSSAKIFFNKSISAWEAQEYYSRASYCFSGSLALRSLHLENFSQPSLRDAYKTLKKQIEVFEQKTDSRQLKTLPDLETYMLVKERIIEAQQVLENINLSNIPPNELSYSFERLYSGIYWSDFFGVPGEPFVLEKDLLKNSCSNKIAEAGERINYVALYFPVPTEHYYEELKQAYMHLQNKNYELCLFKASKVKADADMLFTVLFMDESQIPELLNEKFAQTKKILKSQQQKGMFPILGYSYYEYANSLRNDDPYSSLKYLEYSIELSNLDMYFPPKQRKLEISMLWNFTEISFLAGAVFGAVLTLLFLSIRKDLKQSTSSKVLFEKKTQKDSKKSRNLPGKKR